jgi:hypothetical protein
MIAYSCSTSTLLARLKFHSADRADLAESGSDVHGMHELAEVGCLGPCYAFGALEQR